jgi:hypothetical protein
MNRLVLCGLLCVVAASLGPARAESPVPDNDRQIADELAAMLRAGRTVISNNQARINDPALGDKGLTGAAVLAESVKLFVQATGRDPDKFARGSREDTLIKAQMAAIAEVVDANQTTINAKGQGFKGFIPAVFARLVNEAFERRVGAVAAMKVTAPLDLVRNRKSLPDGWEKDVIGSKFLDAAWPKGQVFAAETTVSGRAAFRLAVPEYYNASCLSCHGGPKGDIDVTGYPKEGGQEKDLGGVISVTLFHP